MVFAIRDHGASELLEQLASPPPPRILRIEDLDPLRSLRSEDLEAIPQIGNVDHPGLLQSTRPLSLKRTQRHPSHAPMIAVSTGECLPQLPVPETLPSPSLTRSELLTSVGLLLVNKHLFNSGLPTTCSVCSHFGFTTPSCCDTLFLTRKININWKGTG